ncbi:metallophosphoesterase family protein [Dictyobacter kobayashii]|uniref:metallophosphoesterase family protein n=1 Tax=Dictyobacter kobayashii TaxID=2014872 RepID=UPI000F82B919|nr:metallophosphoesterase family protein [Dictyobacter kobayashii]
MKIAALYDIHGNLPALKAVLKELESIQPDVIVVGGDIVSGPMPGQTLECLRQLAGNVVALCGNADREVVTVFNGQCTAGDLPEDVYEITQWVAQHIETDQRDFLARLPEQVTLSLGELGEVLFCHATPYSDEELFTPLTPPDRLRLLFQDVKQPVVVCGHTHIQFELHIGGVRVLNAGSVGMPYADHPGAYWLLLGPEGSEFRRTPYDLEAAAQAVRTSGYPQAREFAEENVLKIPTAEEAMEIFERRAAAG